MTEKRRILLTAALPYANGDIHIGHLVEHSLCDFWVRYQRLRGQDCRFICADDTHGTPVMLKARSEGITPEKLIEKYYQRHLKDFQDFSISHDAYLSTHTDANREIASEIYGHMKEQGLLEEKTIQQFFCEHDKMFLPDRFVKGSCPKCKTADQNGDSCDNCGATYETTEVLKPYCSLCEKTPVLKDTDHLYFKLAGFKDFLQGWVREHTPKSLHGKLDEWLGGDQLKNWCISRDAPYFGFEIPDRPGKFFYVWLDAPVGYISATKTWCESEGLNFDDYWKSDKTEIYHVIGKDIVYFHALFWPAMLKISGFQLPKEIFVHGFLTVDGAKMSKSRGTFISAHVFKKHVDPTYLRYYLACKLNDDINDFDLSYDDFCQRVNSDLIGKITNIASRGAQMLQKKLDGKMGTLDQVGRDLVKQVADRRDVIADLYESRQFSKVMIEIRELAGLANKYFDDLEPWKLIKTDPEQTKTCLTVILNVFKNLCVYLKPVLPDYVEKAEKLFDLGVFDWNSLDTIIENHELKPFEHLAGRVEAKAFKAMEDETKEQQPSTAAPKAKTPKDSQPSPSEITIDDFTKVVLKVGLVKNCQDVEGAKKLLQLDVDLGEGRVRTIFSGIKSSYSASDLIGKKVIVVANLKPRKMKFGLSEGMVLASGDKDIVLADPGAEAKIGDVIS